VLHHRDKIGQLGRILLFVDGSMSMSVDDSQMMPKPRKLLAAQVNGWLPEGIVDTTLAKAADTIATAQGTLSTELRGSKLTVAAFLEARSEFKEKLEGVRERIGEISVEIPEPKVREGLLYREVWEGIGGTSVQNLTSNPKFKKDPDSTEYISEFSAPKNVGKNYGQRISGYLVPPLTGNYVFTLLSNDESILYLNPAGNAPNGKKQLLKANLNTQKSQPIPLQAEIPCYVEVLMKQGPSDDFVTVGWILPNGEQETPIPANRLASPTAGSSLQRGDFQTLAKHYHERLIKGIAPPNLPKPDDSNASDRLRTILITVNGISQEYESFLRNAFNNQAETLAQSGDKQIGYALAEFDKRSRWKRVQNLLARDGGLLSQLVETHDVEVFLLKGSAAERLWTPGDTTEEEIELNAKADDPVTDLSTGIRKSLSTEIGGDPDKPDDPDNPSQRTALILFSDGLHNDGESPLHTAKLFGGRDISVNTVGMGGTTPPPDLAILEIENPAAIYVDDRIQGTLMLKDNIGKGRAFTIRIEHEGRPVWEKKLFTHNLQRRRIPFDFAIKEIVEEHIKQTGKDFETNSLPLSMQVVIDPLDEEVRKDNNNAPLVF
ncbi:MAG: PA14 domain-containing protein, partial [Opitutales bacterium]